MQNDIQRPVQPVISGVHLLPLPGAPCFAGSIQTVYDTALREAAVFTVRAFMHQLKSQSGARLK
jgi:predicted TIM-barrel enzyme